MKRSVNIACLLVALFCSTTVRSSATTEANAEKTKSYTKTYTVGSADKVILDNSFGEMKIATWSKNEVKVDVSITVKSGTDAQAQRLIDDITVEDGKTVSEVYFKTKIRNNNNRNNDDDDRGRDGSRTSMKINYLVYLPSGVTLEATNQFGPMTIGDFDGMATLVSKFGSLTAGKLTQVKKIGVEFGQCTIGSINNGKLSIQFSRAQIGHLSGDIDASFNQSRGVKLVLDNSLRRLDINNNFGELVLDADKNLSASFQIKTSFGKFSNSSQFQISRSGSDDDGYVSTSRTYSGKAGSGTVPVNVHSNFGKITLGHDLAFDVNDKSRNRDKGKDRDKDNDE